MVGHNLIGRVQVSAGEQPNASTALDDFAPLLHGEASEQVFLELMASHAASGVSGVVPKFLSDETAALFRKGSVTTERHIVKGSSAHQTAAEIVGPMSRYGDGDSRDPICRWLAKVQGW